MYKRKISSYFGGEKNKETKKDKDQDDLRVEEAEGDGNANPKVAKTSNETRNFQAKWLKEHTWLRYENQAMFCHFYRFGKKKNPFTSDKGCSNFKTTTLTRHVSSREHQDATMEARLRQTFTEVRILITRLFLVMYIHVNDKVIQFTIISVSTEKHIVYVTIAIMIKNFVPQFFPFVPLQRP